ncbi:RNA methyltransferase [Novispirillum sp. DQ9]|uniref:RNA methyltransferase n=1 Tax=Novispirillum sp. DQ9 TaxID=3398612 RepID=UPI003C7EAF77
MAGTDRTRGRPLIPQDVTQGFGSGPAVILVEPQLAENVGTAARAMGNCALTDLRLVNPREDHLCLKALRASSGADAILEAARVFPSTEAAIADLHHVYATTARRRDMMKRILTPRAAAAEIRAHEAASPPQACGILFGRERTGLENDDVALAGAVIEVPLNPSFCSLNLAQAVLLVGYELFTAADATPAEQPPERSSPLATQSDLLAFYKHLEAELDNCGFLRVPDKRPGMVRNIRSMFNRAGLSVQEIRTLHGIVKELRWGRRPDRPGRDENGNVQVPHEVPPGILDQDD